MDHTESMGIATNIILNLASYAMFSNLSKKTWWIGICHPLLSSSEFYVEGATHKQQKLTIYMFTRMKSILMFVSNNLQKYQSAIAQNFSWCFLNGKIMCVSAAHLFLISLGWGTLEEATTAFMFMNCCFCGSPQHNLISKGQGQLQGLDFTKVWKIVKGMSLLYASGISWL